MGEFRRSRLWVGVCSLATVCAGASAQTQIQTQTQTPIRAEVSVGAYYANGNFGAPTETTLAYLPVSLALERGPWRAQLTASRVAVEGAGNVLVNLGGVTQAYPTLESSWRHSTGDTLLELAYTLPEGVLSRLLGNAGADRLGLGLRATTKLPTASAEKGLGTGERDYSIQLDASLPLGGQLLFGSLGYTRRGESAVYSDILSSPFAQLGIARSVSERLSIGALYDYRQSASSLYGDGQELSVYGSLQIDPHWSVSGLVGAGLVSASSDLGVYVLVAYRW